MSTALRSGFNPAAPVRTASPYELKPLGVGGVLDQSIQILKDRFGLFLVILLCLRIPITIVFDYYVQTHQPQIPVQPTPEQMSEVFAQTMRTTLLMILPYSLLELLLISPLTNGAMMDAASRIYLGREANAIDSFRFALRRYFPLVWTAFLYNLLIFAGMLLCILPGFIALFRFALGLPIVIVERLSGLTALQRSGILMRPTQRSHYGQFFLLLSVLAMMQFGLNVSTQYVPQLHLRVLATALLQSIQTAIISVTLVIFYYSCRCRAENYDLFHLARLVSETPVEKTAAEPQG